MDFNAQDTRSSSCCTSDYNAHTLRITLRSSTRSSSDCNSSSSNSNSRKRNSNNSTSSHSRSSSSSEDSSSRSTKGNSSSNSSSNSTTSSGSEGSSSSSSSNSSCSDTRSNRQEPCTWDGKNTSFGSSCKCGGSPHRDDGGSSSRIGSGDAGRSFDDSVSLSGQSSRSYKQIKRTCCLRVVKCPDTSWSDIRREEKDEDEDQQQKGQIQPSTAVDGVRKGAAATRGEEVEQEREDEYQPQKHCLQSSIAVEGVCKSATAARDGGAFCCANTAVTKGAANAFQEDHRIAVAAKGLSHKEIINLTVVGKNGKELTSAAHRHRGADAAHTAAPAEAAAQAAAGTGSSATACSSQMSALEAEHDRDEGSSSCCSNAGITSSNRSNSAMSRETYEVRVEAADMRFSCAHFIAYKGFREKLHGHNYTVAVRVGGAVCDDGYVVDFCQLRSTVRAICKVSPSFSCE